MRGGVARRGEVKWNRVRIFHAKQDVDREYTFAGRLLFPVRYVGL
jgi:hypothetical protein